MRWRAPSFWWETNSSWEAQLLQPLAWAYDSAQRLSGFLRSKSLHASCPVISVGSLVMGGSGKTPLTLALSRLLQRLGKHPLILTRGFGGLQKGPLWVDPHHHTYHDVGDEALLMAQWFPTVVSRRRSDSLTVLSSQEERVLVLDDGHQHHSLKKDLSLLVVDAGQGHGNERVFPAGPLREAWTRGMSRADAIFWIGEENPPPFPKPVLQATLQARSTLRAGTRVLGFAGLGYPLKFRRTLESLQLKVCDFIIFPDHFPYQHSDLEALEETARSHEALLVTTEKDFYRLPSPFRDSVRRIKIDLIWDNPLAVETFLLKTFEKFSRSSKDM